jgi:NAD(P)-dependent dehydrogenase (short-subunit alcohol dehydrogenase family)
MAWDVAGKTVLVTGATSGLGLEASTQLARMGAHVVMVGRDVRRTDEALADVASRSGSREVSRLVCDFSSQASIRGLAEAVRARHDRVHVLVNNAGGVNKTRRVTADGLEMTFAVNHLGCFLLRTCSSTCW